MMSWCCFDLINTDAEPETAVAELEKRVERLEAEKLELVKVGELLYTACLNS